MWGFDGWLARWRREKGIDQAAALTPHESLQTSLIATGEWLLVSGESIVKVAGKRKPSPADVRKIAAGLHAAGKLLDEAANAFELSRRGLRL